MTKAELVKEIAEESGLTQAQAAEALNAFTGAVTKALKAGDKVALVGFGTFSVAARAAREGRNPATGAPLKIAASKNGKFTPGKDLKGL
jgi:DNA-binding protein HU-beta